MVATTASARVGGGGISYTISGDTSQLKAKLSEATRLLSDASKEMKAKPKVEWDLQETSVLRQARAVVRKLQDELAKSQVSIRLEQLGLTQAPSKAALRPAFEGFEAEVRGEIAAAKIAARKAARSAEVTAAAQAYLGVESPRKVGFSPANFDSQVGLLNARAGSGSEAAAARRAAGNAAPEVAMAPEVAARRSLASAQEEYAKSLKEKARDEPATERGTLDDLADARRGRRAPSRQAEQMSIGSLLNSGLGQRVGGLAAFSGAMRLMNSAAEDANSRFMMGSSSKGAAMQGQINLTESWKSVPVVGSIVKLFDEASGFTRALRVRMEASQDMRAATVDAARLTFNRVHAVEKEGAEKLIAMREKYAKDGIEITDQGGVVNATSQGSATDKARREARETYLATKKNVDDTSARALLESQQDNDMRAARTKAERLRSERKPYEAQMAEFDAQADAEATLADPAKRDAINKENAAKRERMVRENKRARDFSEYDTQTDTAASQMRVNNRGLNLEDEGALRTLRAINRRIAEAPDEGGYKGRAKLAGLAEARALQASLVVRGGGNADVVNMETTSVASDPFNILPETQARKRAQKMTGDFVRKMGGDKATDLNAQVEPWRTGEMPTDLLSQILATLEAINDNFGRSAVLPN